jgi:predicted O-methyltransferase YrrM
MRAELQGLPQGWFHHGEKILDLVAAHRPAVTVELGTWRGASAIALARLVRTWGGVVYCVDTWTGQVAGSKGGTIAGKPAMLLECATNIVAAGVGEVVRVIPATTTAAAAAWTLPVDCLYVDADHTYDSVMADLCAWWPYVRMGGLVLGDDYDNPLYPGVTMAWDFFGGNIGQEFQRFSTVNTNPPGMRLVYGVKEQWL